MSRCWLGAQGAFLGRAQPEGRRGGVLCCELGTAHLDPHFHAGPRSHQQGYRTPAVLSSGPAGGRRPDGGREGAWQCPCPWSSGTGDTLVISERGLKVLPWHPAPGF